MSFIAIHGTGSVPPATFRRKTPVGHQQIKSLRRLLRRARRVLATVAKEVGADLPAVSPAAERELSAIRTFALHVIKHPDMPAAHRDRYLTEICKSCEAAMEALS